MYWAIDQQLIFSKKIGDLSAHTICRFRVDRPGREQRAQQARIRRRRETNVEREKRRRLDAERHRVAQETEAKRHVRLQEQAARQKALRMHAF